MVAPTLPPGPRIYRWLLLSVSVVVLALLGLYREQFVLWLVAGWQKLLVLAGLARRAQHLQQGIDGGIAKRPLPAVATYAAGYLATCLLILHLVLPPAQWKLTLRLYAFALGTYLLLTALAKLAGNAAWAYSLSRNLLVFVVSPLPVAGLYVLFRAGFGPAAKRD